MTCDIYGTEINKLNENTEKVNEVCRTLIPLKALMNDSLESCDIERCNVNPAATNIKSLNKVGTEE